MKVNKKLKLLIERKAEKKSRKMINEAEARETKTRLYYLARDEKREKLFDKKLDYINNLKTKTAIKCKEMVDKTTIECRQREQRSKAMVIDILKENNEIQKQKTKINEIYEESRQNYIKASPLANMADESADRASQRLRQ